MICGRVCPRIDDADPTCDQCGALRGDNPPRELSGVEHVQLGADLLTAEFARAKLRSSLVPAWARPIVTR